MKKALKIIGIILGSLIGIIIIVFLVFSAGKGKAAKELYAQLGEEAPELTVDGYTFRDLNKNGSLIFMKTTELNVKHVSMICLDR